MSAPEAKTQLRVVIADDEPLARRRLRSLLGELAGYQVVAEADTGAEALKQVDEFQPDIVLMDIRMPGLDGLQAARLLSKLKSPPALIFCTAYDEYAIEAFDLEAVGYLLKPVNKRRLEQALLRAKKLTDLSLQPSVLAKQSETLAVKTHLGIELLPLQAITHFRADHKYVTANIDGREVVIDETLKQLEKKFDAQFIRIHRNCLVSAIHIETLLRIPGGGTSLRLRGVESPLPVSRRHVALVKKRMQQI